MTRADKLERLASLARLQLRLSEWQFAQLQQRDASLQDEQAWLVGALNRGEPPAGSSSQTLARRLAKTSMDAHAVQVQASRQLDQVRSGSRRVKQLEEVAKAALADKLRDAEKRSLEELNATNPVERDFARRPVGGSKT
jgi:hypothetical protein